MGHFANSFLLELALDKCDNTIDYVKINSLRKPEYQIMTLLCSGEERYALKMPLCDAANGHIGKISAARAAYPGGIRTLECVGYKGGLKYPFLSCRSLADIITEGTGQNPVSEPLKAFFGKFGTEKKKFFGEEFAAVFGGTSYDKPLECIHPANIDLICDNIFYENGEYIIIDNEWCFDFDIPIQFAIWRCINELYYKNPELEARQTKACVLEEFGIDGEMSETFLSWAVHFAEKYVGMDHLLPYLQPLNQLSLLDIYNERMFMCSLNTACYYDTGSGYSEEGKVYTDITLDEDGSFEVTFPLPENTLSVRWDIAEGRLLKCRGGIKNCGGAVITPDNADKSEDGFDIFYTTDPHYTVTGLSGGEFTLFGTIKTLTLCEAWTAAAEFEKALDSRDAAIIQKDSALAEKEIASRLDAKYINSCEGRIKAYFAQLVQKQDELEASRSENAALNAQLEYMRSEDTRIKNSKLWRFMAIFWKLKAKLTNRGN